MNGHSEVPIPGGFGASGAPNDSWHQVLHSLTKSYTRLAVGWAEFPHLRRRLEELEFSVQGQPSTKFLGSSVLVGRITLRTRCSFPYLYYIYIKKHPQIYPRVVEGHPWMK
jgi:hypothetical protein